MLLPLRAGGAARLTNPSSVLLHHRSIPHSTPHLQSRLLAPPPTTTTTLRPFTSTQCVRSGGHEGPSYDPPGGWLWGVPPGQKYENEGWEGIWIYGFFGSMLFLVVGYCYKPDTSIQTWALEEARRRLEAEGILEDPDAKKS